METKEKTGLERRVISACCRSGCVRQSSCCERFSGARLVLTERRLCGAKVPLQTSQVTRERKVNFSQYPGNFLCLGFFSLN